MRRNSITVLLLSLLMLAITGASDPVAAQTCSINISSVNFGSVTPASNTVFDTTGSLTATCSGTGGSTVVVCPNVGNPAPAMFDGTNKLAYGLYRDNAYKTALLTSVPILVVPITALGRGAATQTIYGRIPAGQTSLPANAYTDSVAGQFLYGDSKTPCTLPASYAFQVTANVAANCTVTANSLDFGTISAVSIVNSASTTISVNCPVKTSFTIGLSGGNTAAVEPAARQMSNGKNSLAYGLYTDSALKTTWGGAMGTAGSMVSDTGTGVGQSFTVYGKITAVSLPPPGNYSDTVVVVVTY